MSEVEQGTGEREGIAERQEGAFSEAHLLRVRLGHGANCSSIGSVVDTLFATAVVGAAVFAAVVAALESEDVRVVGGGSREGPAGASSPGEGPPTKARSSPGEDAP
jgi:hypothetical protein